MNKTERKILVLEAALADLEKEYNKAFDELLANDNDTNRSKERRLLQRINEVKKELEGLKSDLALTESELDAMVTGIEAEAQELTEVEEKMFDAIADNF